MCRNIESIRFGKMVSFVWIQRIGHGWLCFPATRVAFFRVRSGEARRTTSCSRGCNGGCRGTRQAMIDFISSTELALFHQICLNHLNSYRLQQYRGTSRIKTNIRYRARYTQSIYDVTRDDVKIPDGTLKVMRVTYGGHKARVSWKKSSFYSSSSFEMKPTCTLHDKCMYQFIE